MTVSGHLTENEMPTRKKYPWHLLTKRGDYFIWDTFSDHQSIRASSPGFKVSCTKKDGKLLVVRQD